MIFSTIIAVRSQPVKSNNSPVIVVPAFSHGTTQNQPGFNDQHGLIIQNGHQSFIYPNNSGSFRTRNAPVHILPDITD